MTYFRPESLTAGEKSIVAFETNNGRIADSNYAHYASWWTRNFRNLKFSKGRPSSLGAGEIEFTVNEEPSAVYVSEMYSESYRGFIGDFVTLGIGWNGEIKGIYKPTLCLLSSQEYSNPASGNYVNLGSPITTKVSSKSWTITYADGSEFLPSAYTMIGRATALDDSSIAVKRTCSTSTISYEYRKYRAPIYGVPTFINIQTSENAITLSIQFKIGHATTTSGSDIPTGTAMLCDFTDISDSNPAYFKFSNLGINSICPEDGDTVTMPSE